VEIGTEAVQFPEKEYINGIFVAVCYTVSVPKSICDVCPIIASAHTIRLSCHEEM